MHRLWRYVENIVRTSVERSATGDRPLVSEVYALHGLRLNWPMDSGRPQFKRSSIFTSLGVLKRRSRSAGRTMILRYMVETLGSEETLSQISKESDRHPCLDAWHSDAWHVPTTSPAVSASTLKNPESRASTMPLAMRHPGSDGRAVGEISSRS